MFKIHCYHKYNKNNICIDCKKRKKCSLCEENTSIINTCDICNIDCLCNDCFNTCQICKINVCILCICYCGKSKLCINCKNKNWNKSCYNCNKKLCNNCININSDCCTDFYYCNKCYNT